MQHPDDPIVYRIQKEKDPELKNLGIYRVHCKSLNETFLFHTNYKYHIGDILIREESPEDIIILTRKKSHHEHIYIDKHRTHM